MPKSIKEWDLIQELMEIIHEIETPERQVFVHELYNNLDPYLPFLEQMSQRQMDYLYAIHDFHVNGNEEAFEDWEE